MAPNPSAPDTASPAEATRLSRPELAVMLAVGLTLAGCAIATGLLLGRKTAPVATSLVPTLSRGHSLSAFTLTNQTGGTVTRAEWAGKFLVVSFVFTSCSLSCRVVNDRMAEIQRLLGPASDVLLVSFTVDPRTDTPPVLAKFAAGYGADTNRWWFLTGPKPELYRVIEESFMSRSRELETLIPGGFENTDRLLLVGQDGRVRATFNGLMASAPRDMVETLNRLRGSGGNGR